MKKLSLVAFTLLSTMSAGYVSAAEGGVVRFNGTVIDAPCSLAAESDDQTVPMGDISILSLTAGTTSTESFQVKLENCVADTKKIAISFNGNTGATNTDLLGVTGFASGVGIELLNMDKGASPIPVNAAAEIATEVLAGDHVFNFGARLVADGTPAPGDFTAETNFILSYL
jgi:type 1 fimbria pilin